MRRILFVDDEPKALVGLERNLEPQRSCWHMSFVSSPEAALEQLEKAAFDVVVSDLKPPRGDSAKLLARVRDRFPSVVRILLAGGSSLEAKLSALPVAHQFLTKPCDTDVLRVAVERACNLKGVLKSDLIDRLVGGTQQLPALPRTYAALVSALSSSDVSVNHLAAIVEQDVAISARILQVVNSPLFGLTRQVSTVRTGMSYLGIETVKGLVLSFEVARLFEPGAGVPGFSLENLHAHGHLTASIARQLPTDRYLKDAAGVAALMHDIGKLILATRSPAHLKQALERAKADGRPLHEVEEELLGVSHAEIGAYLLGFWGLPFPVIEAVAHHHHPRRLPQASFDALATVHVANVLAHEVAGEAEPSPGVVEAEVDMDYLNALGYANDMTAWRSAAATVVNSLRAA